MSVLIEVTLISLGLSFLLVLLSKVLTNQTEIKRIKQETVEYKKKIKEAQKEKNEAAVKDYTSKMFKLSQGQFKYSTKSMLVSMIVVVFAFSWLGGKYGNIAVDLTQTEEGQHLALMGEVGPEKQKVIFYDNTNLALDKNKNSQFDQEEKLTTEDLASYDGSYLKFSKPQNNKTLAEIIPAKTPFKIPYVGNNLTWFWLYVFITVPTTFIFRKLLDVQ